MYIQRRNGGRYYFRMAIPSRLMGYYGRREICLSLGTADRKEAKVKSLPLIQKYLMEFEGKRMETADIPAVEHSIKEFKFSSIYEEYLKERKLGAGSISDFNTVMNRGKVGTKGAISDNFSRWYGMYLDEIGLKDKKLTFHSYRHSFKLFGRRAGDVPCGASSHPDGSSR